MKHPTLFAMDCVETLKCPHHFFELLFFLRLPLLCNQYRNTLVMSLYFETASICLSLHHLVTVQKHTYNIIVLKNYIIFSSPFFSQSVCTISFVSNKHNFSVLCLSAQFLFYLTMINSTRKIKQEL